MSLKGEVAMVIGGNSGIGMAIAVGLSAARPASSTALSRPDSFIRDIQSALRWVLKFGPMFARELRRRRRLPTTLGKEARIRHIGSQLRTLSQTLNSWRRTQSCETSLRGSNSLFTGKRTGNFSNFGRFRRNPPLKNSHCQCVTRKFPANPTGNLFRRTGNFFVRIGNSGQPNREGQDSRSSVALVGLFRRAPLRLVLPVGVFRS